MSLSKYDSEAYEPLKKSVINQLKNMKWVEPSDLYLLAELLPLCRPNDKLPVCLLCRDPSKQPSQLGHIFPHSALKEFHKGGNEYFFDTNRGTERGISRMGYYAFCKDCEIRFQQGEVSFNPEFFKKLVQNPKGKIVVEATKILNDKKFPWLYYALISIFWRLLCLNNQCNDHHSIKVKESLREYLLDWEASSKTLHRKVKLFLFVPNSEIDDKLAKDPELNSFFFYKWFYSIFDHLDLPKIEPDAFALRGWFSCGPLHVTMIYSEEEFKALRILPEFEEWEEMSMLTTNTKKFTIGAHNSRYFPVSLYDRIVKWGLSTTSSAVRLPSVTKDSISSTPVEVTHLHLLPKDVSYDATNDKFRFSPDIFKKRTVTRDGSVTCERVKRGSEEILFVAIKGVLENGGEIAIGLNIDPDGTVSYMKGVNIPQTVSMDLNEILFKEEIEEFIKKFDV